MKTLFVGKNCIKIEKIDSTNSHLQRLIRDNDLSEGTIVTAYSQEQGRGQRGTAWHSDEGKNLILSILLKPTFLKAEDQFWLNKAVSLAVAEFVTSTPSLELRSQPSRSARLFKEKGVRDEVKIKWPNDIYIGNKKVAGILIENSVNGNVLQQSVVGIGININQMVFSEELPNPTSLQLISGKEFDLEECLSLLCSSIENNYLQLKAGKSAQLDYDYLKNLYCFGQWAQYAYQGQKIMAKIIYCITLLSEA